MARKEWIAKKTVFQHLPQMDIFIAGKGIIYLLPLIRLSIINTGTTVGDITFSSQIF